MSKKIVYYKTKQAFKDFEELDVLFYRTEKRKELRCYCFGLICAFIEEADTGEIPDIKRKDKQKWKLKKECI